MIFKSDWEKIDAINNISSDLIIGMIAKAFPNNELRKRPAGAAGISL